MLFTLLLSSDFATAQDKWYMWNSALNAVDQMDPINIYAGATDSFPCEIVNPTTGNTAPSDEDRTNCDPTGESESF